MKFVMGTNLHVTVKYVFPGGMLGLQFNIFGNILVILIEIGIFFTTMLLKASVTSFKCFISCICIIVNVDWNWGRFSINLLMVINFER